MYEYVYVCVGTVKKLLKKIAKNNNVYQGW